MNSKGYRDLEIYQLAYQLAMKIHHMSLKLPKYELYEEGGQIRRSSKGVASTIVEDYGRRKYKTILQGFRFTLKHHVMKPKFI